MAKNILKPIRYVWCSSLILGIATSVCAEELQELDEFIAEETALEDSNSLMPSDLSVDSVYGGNIPVAEVPKAVIVLTPEEMEQFGIDKLSDLANVGAGTAQYNDFGLPGAPYLRGWKAGIYFNGMLRGYQVNELPTSFGSLERIDLVKGIAPAQYLPTNIGGYANFVPKSPYFDENRGSVELSITDYGQWKMEFDVGGPTMLFDKIPSAYRVSITGQEGDAYYNNVKNNYLSVYASIKAQVAKNIKVYTGAEYFTYKSNEQPGWNRLTQDLIDNNNYIIGEPLSLVDSTGMAERDTLDFANYIINYGGSGYGLDLGSDPMSSTNLHGFSNRAEVFQALCVSESAVQSALSAGTITQDQVNAMINMSDASVRADVYNGMDGVAQTTSGYVYTPEYFDLGGTALTENIDGKDILADKHDKADSTDVLFFMDLVDTVNPDLTLTNKIYAEYMDTEKESSYGYASQISQRIFDDRAQAEKTFTIGGIENDLLAGIEYRYTWARGLQDYWIEPFNRRDLTQSSLSGNTTIAVGDGVSSNGGTYWTNGNADDPSYLGNNRVSELHQVGVFASLNTKWTEWLTTYAGAREEYAKWTLGIPSEVIVDYSIEDVVGEGNASGDTTYYNLGFSPVISITKDINLYASVSKGTTYVPNDFGFIMGEDSFADADYYEGGVKANLFGGRLFTTASVYSWKQTGFSTFSTDPQEYEGRGYEWEATLGVTSDITLITSFTHQVVKNKNGIIPYGSRDYASYYLADGSTAQGIALGSGIFYANIAFPAATANTDLEVPGTPQNTFKMFAVYSMSEHWTVSGGFVWSDDYYANYENTISIPAHTVFNANLMYRTDKFEVKLAVDNLFDEEYYYSSDPVVGGNILVTQAPGLTSTISFKYKF